MTPWWLKLYVELKLLLRKGRKGARELARKIIEEHGITTAKDAAAFLFRECQYEPDPLWGLIDIQKDLPALLKDKAGDCDDFALSLCRLLSALGFRTYYVTAVAERIWDNHAFVVFEQNGFFQLATPYIVLSAQFTSLDEAVEAMAKSCGARYRYWYARQVT